MVCLQVDIFEPQIIELVALYCKSLKVTRKSFSSSPSRVGRCFRPAPLCSSAARDDENDEE